MTQSRIGLSFFINHRQHKTTPFDQSSKIINNTTGHLATHIPQLSLLKKSLHRKAAFRQVIHIPQVRTEQFPQLSHVQPVLRLSEVL